MQEKTRKILLFVLLGIAVIAAAFAVLFVVFMPDKDNMTPDAYAQAMNSIDPLFTTAATIVYALVFAALIAIALFFVVQFVKYCFNEPKKAIKIGVVIGLIAVLFFASWLIAKFTSGGTDVPESMLKKFGLTTTDSLLISTACISVYILFFVSLVSIIVTAVMKSLKK